MVLGTSVWTLRESDRGGDGDCDCDCSLADSRWVRAVTSEGLDNDDDCLRDDWVRVLVVMMVVVTLFCLVGGGRGRGLLP